MQKLFSLRGGYFILRKCRLFQIVVAKKVIFWRYKRRLSYANEETLSFEHTFLLNRLK